MNVTFIKSIEWMDYRFTVSNELFRYAREFNQRVENELDKPRYARTPIRFDLSQISWENIWVRNDRNRQCCLSVTDNGVRLEDPFYGVEIHFDVADIENEVFHLFCQDDKSDWAPSYAKAPPNPGVFFFRKSNIEINSKIISLTMEFAYYEI